MRLSVTRLDIASAGLAIVATFGGCSDESRTPAGQSAEQAVGVQPGEKSTETVATRRDVIVEEEKRVIDAKTGEVLSDRKTDTPVSITEKKELKTTVQVDVGTPKPNGK